ncbi:MAG: succinylglutamate desuccinylase/aspartoacylase family protein [Patescibacteria group bacterium]
MFEDVIEIKGVDPGPTSMVIAGVHGDEKSGVAAFAAILPTLSLQKGRVFFAYGSPRAITAHTRFVEANLNRLFKPDEALSDEERKSYEYTRAQFLKQYLDQADALLDIHASYVPQSRPFVICEANAKDIVPFLPVDLVVTGFDAVQPGGTDYYMNSRDKVGICIETGYLGDPSSLQVAEQGVYAFLSARGHMVGDTPTYPQSYIRMDSLYLTKNESFTRAREFADFEDVRTHQELGEDGDTVVRAEYDGVIVFARDITGIGEEAFLLGRRTAHVA